VSERDSNRRPGVGDEGGLHAPPDLGPLGKVWWWFHFAVLVKLARLRFIAVLVAVGAVIAYWDTLNAYYAKWTRPVFGPETAANPDVEWWCPMHPTIVRDHADKCPICAMPLSRRKKGDKHDNEALPPGIVSRVPLTPYKMAVAGIETAEVGLRPLTREIHAVGLVEFDERKLARIAARPTGKSRIDKLYANVTGQEVRKGDVLALLYSRDVAAGIQNLFNAKGRGNGDIAAIERERLLLLGIDQEEIAEIEKGGKPCTHVHIRSPIGGHVIKKYQVEGEYVEEGARLYDVADLSTVWIEAQIYEDEIPFVRDGLGLAVTATTRAFPNREFHGKLSFIYPHLDAATRTLKVRFDIDNPRHDLFPGAWATVRLQVPATRLDLLPADASEKQQQAAREGQVLAVPERAVIDTGSRKFVYRETEPDVFEGVEVELGPRCGDAYPVVRGLREGDRVATTGSFLIDAETRLSAGAASTYFGASNAPQSEHRSAAVQARPSMTRDVDSKVQAALAKLDAADRRLAEAQKVCPVLGTRLGAMGVPVAVTLGGEKVFLCCKSCIKDARADEKGTLAKVAELKGGKTVSRPDPPAPADLETRVKASLAQLSAEDRRLAEAQGFCPIQQRVRLGKMGVPVAVTIKGRKVFLCCEGCRDEALENPDQTLAQVEKLKAKTPRHGTDVQSVPPPDGLHIRPTKQ
jgi:Cu(I)/Ag(I) efflux system membrane fusion protein